MPRDLRAVENRKRTKARREFALERLDLRRETVPRESALGPTSQAVKVMDPASAAAIAAFMERKNGR